MKKLIFILSCFLAVLQSQGQVKQPYNQYGAIWKRLQSDSALKLPLVIVGVKDGNAGLDTGQVWYSKPDSTIKVYTGSQWISVGSASTPTLQQVLAAGRTIGSNDSVVLGGYVFKFVGGTFRADSLAYFGALDESPPTGTVVAINSRSTAASFLKLWDTDGNVTRFNFKTNGNITTASGDLYDASNHTLQASTGNFSVKTITPIVSNTQGANDLLQLAPGASDGRVGIGVNAAGDNLTDKLQVKGGVYFDVTGKTMELVGIQEGEGDSVYIKNAAGKVGVRSFADLLTDYGGGGGGGSAGRLSKSLNANTTATGNTGTGEDNLMTYTIPADTLNTAGDQIEFTMAFTFAANTNGKRVRVYYGSTTIYDSGSQNQNSGSMEIRGTIVRTGATSQLISFSQNNDAALFPIRSGYTTAAETLSSTVVLKATAEGVSDNDIQQILFTVKMVPNS